MATIAALCVGALALAACGDSSDSPDRVTAKLPEGGNLLFVLRGPGSAEDGRIEIEADSVEWFTDRPERKAGIGELEELARNWAVYGYRDSPPNAAVSGDETDAVVELENPEINSDGISFRTQPVRGRLADGDLGDVSAFIDSTSYHNCYGRLKNDTDYTWELADATPSVGSARWNYGPPKEIPARSDSVSMRFRFQSNSKSKTGTWSYTTADSSQQVSGNLDCTYAEGKAQIATGTGCGAGNGVTLQCGTTGDNKDFTKRVTFWIYDPQELK